MFTSNRLPIGVIQQLPMYRVATTPMIHPTDINGQLMSAALDGDENADPMQRINLNRSRFRSFYEPRDIDEEPADPRQNILRSIQSAPKFSVQPPPLLPSPPPSPPSSPTVVAAASASSYKRRLPPPPPSPFSEDSDDDDVIEESRLMMEEARRDNLLPTTPKQRRKVSDSKQRQSLSPPPTSPPPPPPPPPLPPSYHTEMPVSATVSSALPPTRIPQHVLDATPLGHMAFYVPPGYNLALLPWKIPRRRFHPFSSVSFRRHVDDPRPEVYPDPIIPSYVDEETRRRCEEYVEKIGGGWSTTNPRRLVNEDVLSRLIPDESIIGGHWITFDPRWNDLLDGRSEKYDLNAAVVVESDPYILPLTVPEMFSHIGFQDARGTYRLIYPDPEWPGAVLPSDRILRMKKLMDLSAKSGSPCYQIVNGKPLDQVRRGRWLYLPRYPKGFDPLHTSSEEDLPPAYRASTTRKRAAYDAAYIRRERQRENRMRIYLRFLEEKRHPPASSPTSLVDRKKPHGSAVPLLGWNKVSRRAGVVQARKTASTLSALKIAVDKNENDDDDERAKRVYNCRLCLEDGHSRQTCPFRFCVRCMVGGHTSEWCPREILDYGWEQYACLTAKKKKSFSP